MLDRLLDACLVRLLLPEAVADGRGGVVVACVAVGERRAGQDHHAFPAGIGQTRLRELLADLARDDETLPLRPADHGLGNASQIGLGHE